MSFNRHVYFDGNPLINPSTLIPNDRLLAIYRQIADDVASENITAGRVGTMVDFYAFQEIPHRMNTAIGAEEDSIRERAGASMASNSSTRPDDAFGTSRSPGIGRRIGSTLPEFEAFGLQEAISHPGNRSNGSAANHGSSVTQGSTAAHVPDQSEFFDFDQASNTAATIPQDGDSTKFNIEDPKGKRAAPLGTISTSPPKPSLNLPNPTTAPPSDTYLEQHKASVITGFNLTPEKEHDLRQLLQNFGWPTPYENLTKVLACRRGDQKWEWDVRNDNLLKGIREIMGPNWEELSTSFFVGKTKYDCAERYNEILRSSRERETLG